MTRVVLSEQDFTKLINGEVVEKNEVQFILEDIGYHQMIAIIQAANIDLVKTYLKKNE